MWRLTTLIFLAICTSVSLMAQIGSFKVIRVKVESKEPGLGVELVGALMKEGVKHKLDFQVVSDGEYDYRITVVGERSGTALGGAQTGAVVLNPDCELVLALIRSGRWSKSGAARAVGKQLAKDFASLEMVGQLKLGSTSVED